MAARGSWHLPVAGVLETTNWGVVVIIFTFVGFLKQKALAKASFVGMQELEKYWDEMRNGLNSVIYF